MKYKISKRQRIKANRQFNKAKEWLKNFQIANGITEVTTTKKLREAEQCPFPSQ